MVLPKQYRLTRPKDFSRVHQKGKQASTRNLVVKFVEQTGQSTDDCPRFGVTISQKVSKKAVVRNRLKRQVKAALQQLLPHVRAGLWVVILLRSASVQCDYWQFLQELEQIFLELEVIDGY